MKEESENCTRKRIELFGENAYLTIGKYRIMAHFPNESSYKNKDFKAMLNLNCRLMSKARTAGISWRIIIKQLRDVNIGLPVVTDKVADAIEGCRWIGE